MPCIEHRILCKCKFMCFQIQTVVCINETSITFLALESPLPSTAQMSKFFTTESSSCGEKNKQSRHLASSTNKLKTRQSFLYGRYHRDTFLSLCILQILLLCLLLILLAHHRRWDWLHKWIPLQQTLMVKNLLPLLLNLPFNRNI